MLKKPITLGILSVLRDNSDLPFGSQTEPFKEIINVARKKGITAFVFTLDGLNLKFNTTYGYIPIEEPPQWECRYFKMPKIIYNRLPNRTSEQREDIQPILSKVAAQYEQRFFNPFFLNKEYVYKALYENKSTRKFLPETRKLSWKNLFEIIEKHGSAYLKPAENSLGLGISKWTANKTLQQITYTRLNKFKKTIGINDFQELWPKYPFHEKPYLVQQGINLAYFRNNPFDFRVLYQKDGTGSWKKTGFAARVAGEDRITTHVVYGGSRESARRVLEESFGKTAAKQIIKEIAALAEIVPPLLEKSLNSSFGEMEIDIGVDVEGKLWIFEVNSKPFKFDEPIIRAKSLVRLMDYVTYLAKS